MERMRIAFDGCYSADPAMTVPAKPPTDPTEAFTFSSGAFSDSALMSLAEDEPATMDARGLADGYK